mgnify:CR=1 FL=1
MATSEARWKGDLSKAQMLLAAIDADDPDLFDCSIIDHGNDVGEIVIRVECDDIASMQSIMDDILACISAAEVSLQAIEN